MKPKKRQKLCHNCEGEIDVDVIVCPFCAADLREEKPEERNPPFHANLRNLQTGSEPLQPLYSRPLKQKIVPEEEPPSPPEATFETEDVSEKKQILSSIVFFTLGVQLCLLGLLMLLFSHKGVVLLKWDARFWILYVGISLPFLYFGYKSLSKIS